jgi:hypothetical protein
VRESYGSYLPARLLSSEGKGEKARKSLMAEHHITTHLVSRPASAACSLTTSSSFSFCFALTSFGNHSFMKLRCQRIGASHVSSGRRGTRWKSRREWGMPGGGRKCDGGFVGIAVVNRAKRWGEADPQPHPYP